MRWIIMVLLMVMAIMMVICYSLMVMAHDADERYDKMYRDYEKWKESKDE